MNNKYLIFVILLLALLIPGVAIAADISDADYHGAVTVTNNGTSTSNVSTVMDLNTADFIANFGLSTDFDDVALLTNLSTDAAYMPGYGANPWVLFVTSIGNYTTLNYNLYTGNVTGGILRYFPGSTGMTTSDDASLEPSDNFTMEWKGRFDASATGNITNKDDAYTVNATTGTIQASILPEVIPTGYTDPSSTWSNETQAYDENTGTGTADNVAASSWSGYLQFERATTDCRGINIYARKSTGYVDTIDVDFYYSSAWHDFYEGTGYSNGAWSEISGNTISNVEQIRVRFYNSHASIADDAIIYEIRFLDDISVTTDAITSGEHTVITDMKSPFLSLGIDAGEAAQTTIDSDDVVLGALPYWESYDGTDDYFDSSAAVASLAATTTGSWELWAKMADVTPAALSVLASFADTAGSTEYIRIYVQTDGTIQANCVDAGVEQWRINQDAASIANDTWFHVVLTQDGTLPIIYVDGSAPAQTTAVAVDTTAWFADLANIDNGRLACFSTNGAGNANFFNGLIGGYFVFDTAITSTQVGTEYALGNPDAKITPDADNLVLNAPLWQTECDADPFTTIDSNALTATLGAGAAAPTWSSTGYDFNAADSEYIDCTNDAVLDSNNFTIIAWIYSDALADRSIFSKNTNYVTDGYQFMIRANGRLAIVTARAGGADYEFTHSSIGDITTGTWYHVACVVESGVAGILYIDAANSTASASVHGNNTSVGQTSYIGAQGGLGGQFWDGKIGEVRFYDVPLSADDILRDYNATKSKYTTGDIYTYSTLASVPDNANDITDCTNYVMPYIEYVKRWVGGALVQSIAWEYDTTFTDLSGNSNDATPSFRTTSSDADVSAELTSFEAITLSTSDALPSSSWPETMTEVPPEPDTAYTEEERPGFFFEPIVHAILNIGPEEYRIPESFFWYNFCFFIIILAGMLSYRIYPSLLLKSFIMGAIMIFFASEGLNVYGMYTALYFGFYVGGVILISRSYGL